MNIKKQNGKYIIDSNGEHLSLTLQEIDKLSIAIAEIYKKEILDYKCFVHANVPFDTCVWDEGNANDCFYAAQGIEKEECIHWKPELRY